MKDNKKEIRSLSRAPEGNAESRRIAGYAIVFDSESRVLCDWGGEFVETIEREAVSEELIANADVKCLFNHNREALLARSNKGEGTLTLTIDEVGLRYEFDAPNTIDGDKVLELVRRGDIVGSSFAFSCAGEDACRYYEDADGMLHRVVRRITGLYDVSPVIDPAYTQTSVEARSWEKPVEDIAEKNVEVDNSVDADAGRKASAALRMRAKALYY
jgi:HK97 family phage prohead protease